MSVHRWALPIAGIAIAIPGLLSPDSPPSLAAPVTHFNNSPESPGDLLPFAEPRRLAALELEDSAHFGASPEIDGGWITGGCPGRDGPAAPDRLTKNLPPRTEDP